MNGTGVARRARLGVIGLGRMGAVHTANLAGVCSSAELAVCFDTDRDRAAAIGGRLGAAVAPSLDALLSGYDLAGVVVATPTPTHAEVALAAVAVGLPVFCEKPISLERSTTLEVVKRFEAAGVLLQIGFNRRFDTTVADVARRVHEGEVGTPYLLRISQRDQAPPPMSFLAGSGGIFLDMGIHDFDMARFLVGDIVSVQATGAARSDSGFSAIGDFDTAVVTVEFANGAIGIIDLSRVAGYGYESAAELMGQRATVRIEPPPALAAEWRRPGEATRPLITSYDRRYGPAFAAELDAFANAILDGTPSPVTGWDALAAFDLAVAAARSCVLGRKVVPGAGADETPSSRSDGRAVPSNDQGAVPSNDQRS